MKILFDKRKLNHLMESANVSLILANTRHNIRYLSGGYYYHFHVNSTRMAKSQYLPFVGIPRERFEEAFYVGRTEERGQIESEGLWIPNIVDTVRGTLTAAESVIKTVKAMGLEGSTIGVELPFIPADTFLALQKGLPKVKFIDATFILDEFYCGDGGNELVPDHLTTSLHVVRWSGSLMRTKIPRSSAPGYLHFRFP